MTSPLQTLRTWGGMVKFSHSIFAMPFALMAAFLAGRNIEGRGWPFPGQLGLMIVCMVGARSAAMTFNRIADARFDALNPRTSGRALPAGTLSTRAAWTFLSLAVALFLAGCLGFYFLYDNVWPLALSVPVLLYLCAYSLTKRFTRWSHLFLGSAVALSPLAAWLAVHPSTVGVTTFMLAATVACWAAGFDVIYSCQDIEFDRGMKLFSLPAAVGPKKALWIARGLHALALLGLIAIGWREHLGPAYAAGVVAAAVLLVVENALVRPGDYRYVNVAFFTVNGLVSLILCSLAILDLVMNLPRSSR